MSELIKRKASARYTILVGAVFLLAALMARADDSISNELQRCSSIEDTSARLACYDGLSGRHSAAPIAPSAKVDPSSVELSAVGASAVEQSANNPLADPSPEAVRGDTDDRYETVTIQGTVTKCRQDDNKKYYFYFENGQVWKQSDRKRLKFKDCDFNVTITKDFFGSKMQQEGEDRRIRITRVK
jgi:hypothetical protein